MCPKIYAAAMLLLNTRNNRVNCFQKLVALLLWKGQLKSNMFKRLRMFGITASRAVALRTVDVSNKNYDQKLQRWRRAISEQESIKSPFSVGANEEVEEWIDVPIEANIEQEDNDQDIQV
ncbi:uncharacterized protein [Amphiura filiformis]|uniref:uncharacterized protein n=1 Tax=Amphiura filiformis TaxID=82378 RepID=UPI003B2168C4